MRDYPDSAGRDAPEPRRPAVPVWPVVSVTLLAVGLVMGFTGDGDRAGTSGTSQEQEQEQNQDQQPDREQEPGQENRTGTGRPGEDTETPGPGPEEQEAEPGPAVESAGPAAEPGLFSLRRQGLGPVVLTAQIARVTEDGRDELTAGQQVRFLLETADGAPVGDCADTTGEQGMAECALAVGGDGAVDPAAYRVTVTLSGESGERRVFHGPLSGVDPVADNGSAGEG
ncbi:hypothetical protein [Streptomyces aidingensis]|uniref:Uncharacterized protein n=1 Tax=Streptomyces aidingensis TaxID=910347 RepID=A0A1I1EC17_9ACTN|nr:hypothetical protein [Streptomyces aidingensis]SFB84699.1 hypothetical protein SAMN05421773_101241 [Streptomyces aidingensis]